MNRYGRNKRRRDRQEILCLKQQLLEYKLYNDLQKGTAELNRVLLDLKKYPEKYVPVPFTKSQRKKAKAESKKDKQVWPDSTKLN